MQAVSRSVPTRQVVFAAVILCPTLRTGIPAHENIVRRLSASCLTESDGHVLGPRVLRPVIIRHQHVSATLAAESVEVPVDIHSLV